LPLSQPLGWGIALTQRNNHANLFMSKEGFHVLGEKKMAQHKKERRLGLLSALFWEFMQHRMVV